MGKLKPGAATSGPFNPACRAFTAIQRLVVSWIYGNFCFPFFKSCQEGRNIQISDPNWAVISAVVLVAVRQRSCEVSQKLQSDTSCDHHAFYLHWRWLRSTTPTTSAAVSQNQPKLVVRFCRILNTPFHPHQRATTCRKAPRLQKPGQKTNTVFINGELQ